MASTQDAADGRLSGDAEMQKLHNGNHFSQARFKHPTSSHSRVEWAWYEARRHLTNYLTSGPGYHTADRSTVLIPCQSKLRRVEQIIKLLRRSRNHNSKDLQALKLGFRRCWTPFPYPRPAVLEDLRSHGFLLGIQLFHGSSCARDLDILYDHRDRFDARDVRSLPVVPRTQSF